MSARRVTCCLHSAHSYAIDGKCVQGKRLPVVDRLYMAMKAAFAVKAGQMLRLTADKQGARLTNTGNAAVNVVLCGNPTKIAPGETVKENTEYEIQKRDF